MFNVPYSTDTIKIPNALVPGNEESDSPLEFDIVPAWGPDLARLKSVVIALTGTADDGSLSSGNWTPVVQEAVIKAFETGAAAFANTVGAVRNMTVPARMAVRAGIVPSIPPSLTPDSPMVITTGAEFSRIAGHPELAGIALFIAFKVVALSGQQNIDPRFFAQPSGSGGPAILQPTTSTAGNVPRRPRRRGTAGNRPMAANPQSGTSAPKPS